MRIMFKVSCLLIFALALSACDFLFTAPDKLESFTFKASDNSQISKDYEGIITDDDKIYVSLPYSAVSTNKFFKASYSTVGTGFTLDPGSGSSFDVTTVSTINIKSGGSVKRSYKLYVQGDFSTYNFLKLESPYYKNGANKVYFSGYTFDTSEYGEILFNVPAGQYAAATSNVVGFDSVTLPASAAGDFYTLRYDGVNLPFVSTVTSGDGVSKQYTITPVRIPSPDAGVLGVEIYGKYQYTRDLYRTYNKSNWQSWYNSVTTSAITVQTSHSNPSPSAVRSTIGWNTSDSEHSYHRTHWSRAFSGTESQEFRPSISWRSPSDRAGNGVASTMLSRRDAIDSAKNGKASTSTYTTELQYIPVSGLTFRNNLNIPVIDDETLPDFSQNYVFNLGTTAWVKSNDSHGGNYYWYSVPDQVYTLTASQYYSYTALPLVLIEGFRITLEPFATASNFVQGSDILNLDYAGDTITLSVTPGTYSTNKILLIFDVESETGDTNTFVLRSEAIQ